MNTSLLQANANYRVQESPLLSSPPPLKRVISDALKPQIPALKGNILDYLLTR